jgi:hypothetical protein
MIHLTRDEVLAELRAQIAAAGSQRAWAHRAGVGAAHVTEVLSGHKTPGPKILAPLGYEAHVVYVKRGS